MYKLLSLDGKCLYKSNITVQKITFWTLKFVIANLDIIGIYSLVILRLRIIKVDFTGNTENIFFNSIENTISKYQSLSKKI